MRICSLSSLTLIGTLSSIRAAGVPIRGEKMKVKALEKEQKAKKSFLDKILKIGKIMAEKSKDPKICKAIKDRANY